MTAVTGVYEIRHTSGARYVGSSKDVYARWTDHLRKLRHGSHHAKKFQQLWNQGSDAFSFGVLRECDRADLIRNEQEWIDATPRELLLNGASVAAAVSSDPTIAAKIAAALVGKRHSNERRAAISRGKKGVVTDAMKVHLRKLHASMRGRTGRRLTAEARLKISESWDYRRAAGVSDETRRRMSESGKARWAALPKTTKAKSCKGCGIEFDGNRKFCTNECLLAWRTTRTIGTDTRQKISSANTGRTASLATRAAMSAARIGKPLSAKSKEVLDQMHADTRLRWAYLKSIGHQGRLISCAI